MQVLLLGYAIVVPSFGVFVDDPNAGFLADTGPRCLFVSVLISCDLITPDLSPYLFSFLKSSEVFVFVLAFLFCHS